MMGVAERVRDMGQRIIGFEVVMNDDAAYEAFGQGAALCRLKWTPDLGPPVKV